LTRFSAKICGIEREQNLKRRRHASGAIKMATYTSSEVEENVRDENEVNCKLEPENVGVHHCLVRETEPKRRDHLVYQKGWSREERG